MVKWTTIGILLIGILILVALPFAVPPVVTQIVEEKLGEFGVPARMILNLGYAWTSTGPGIAGDFRVFVPGTDWSVRSEFSAAPWNWQASVDLQETRFSESDPLVSELLQRFPQTAVSNLVFSGSIAFHAKIERRPGKPLPVWSVSLPVKNASADMISRASDAEISFGGLSLAPEISGIGKHADITPISIRAASLYAGGTAFTNLHAIVMATRPYELGEKETPSLLITTAEAGVCGGKASLYSVYVDPNKLNAGLTLFLDEIDTGKALSLLSGFHGSASGRLHGKVTLFLWNGERLRVKDAFLYSTPGEIGKLRVDDPEKVADTLALAGLDNGTRGNVANALADLDYYTLKLDLRREGEKGLALGIRLEGKATRNDLTVPVDIGVTFHGDIEQIINTGLKISNQSKGKQQ